MKINISWGELAVNSALKEALLTVHSLLGDLTDVSARGSYFIDKHPLTMIVRHLHNLFKIVMCPCSARNSASTTSQPFQDAFH